MTHRKGPRPGGRSARVQKAVHTAVRALEAEIGRENLTVPAIAERADVTPSTIYRRWGDLPQLLSDVALENMVPETAPADTGSFRSDIEAWLAQYHDEMSSGLGRMMLRDLLACSDEVNASQCAFLLREQFEVMRKRAIARGEKTVESDMLIDRVVAPLIFRVLYSAQIPDFASLQQGLKRLLEEATLAPA